MNSMNISALVRKFNNAFESTDYELEWITARAVAHIVKKYFLLLAPSFVLTVCCHHSYTCGFYSGMLEKFLNECNEPLQIVVLWEPSKANISGRRYLNMMVVDSYKTFLEMDIITHTEKYDTNEYYYIILHTITKNNIYNEMQGILEYCWRNYLINCNVQVQSSQGGVRIYTYYPFTQNHCGKVTPTLINQFDGGQLKIDQLFPQKLRNFYGCALKAAVWNVPPFLMLQTYRNGTHKIVGGFEGAILSLLALKLNFTLDIRIPPNDERQGGFLKEGINGALAMLRDRTADLSLGCFRQSAERNAVGTSTFNYFRSKLIVTSLSAPYKLTSLQILLFPFETEAWLITIVLCAMTLLIQGSINWLNPKFPRLFPQSKRDHSYTNILLMTIGMPARAMPSRNHYRLLYISWMFFSLVIRTIYQSMLFHLIRSSQLSILPKTFDELITNNVTFVGNRPTHFLLAATFPDVTWELINTSLEAAAFEFIETKQSKNYVAAAPLDMLVYYCVIKKKVDLFQILPEAVSDFPVSMYLSKHSFLIDQFDSVLLCMRNGGLTNFWYHRYVDIKYFSKFPLRERHFGMAELNMIFILFCCGICISSFVFLLELLSMRLRPLRYILLKI